MDGTSPGYSGLGPPEAIALREGGASDVARALVAIRQRTLSLARQYEDALGPDLPVPHRPDLNPPRWEWGHVAWFQEWWISRNPERELGVEADPDVARPASRLHGADALFDSGRVAHATRWSLPLPDAAALRDYLALTLEEALAGLGALPEDAALHRLYFHRLVALHEAMHAEAATYMAQTLGIGSGASPSRSIPAGAHPELFLPAQRHRLGSDGKGFAFDNELAGMEVEVEAGWIDAQPVTWARYLPFVEAGGYEDPRWWDGHGAAWRAQADPVAPLALRRRRGEWEQRFGAAWQPLDPGTTAVHLTLHEARAWCRWAGRALPTEAQWECAALTLPAFRWGGAWEWTASAFLPFPGFAPHPYRDYSAPWFGTRQVLRGAAPSTSPWLAHARYRNFFEPHRRDVPAGFRSFGPHAGG